MNNKCQIRAEINLEVISFENQREYFIKIDNIKV